MAVGGSIPLLLPVLLLELLQTVAEPTLARQNDATVLRDTSNKALLKNRLLENLNSFFGDAETVERLEMLDTSKSRRFLPSTDDIDRNEVVDVPRAANPRPFPTLIPTAATMNPLYDEIFPAPPPNPKLRAEGRITSERTLESIRDWRRRLYKAFKQRSHPPARIVAPPPHQDVDEPTIAERRQSPPAWQSMLAAKQVQTFGRDSNGKLIPLFGADARRFRYEEPVTNQQAIRPYPPQAPSRESRMAYRTPGGQAVVYLPAPESYRQSAVPVPAASYLVTANPQQPTQAQVPVQIVQVVPALPGMQLVYPASYNAAPNYAPQNGAGLSAPSVLQPFTFTPAPQPSTTPLPYSTFGPPSQPGFEDSDLHREESEDFAMNHDCSMGQCATMSDEKCNSLRLRTIIQNNIIATDAEGSKRAVQSAAEAETGQYFDAVCGTGFFSYIAHTDEFCLASSGGVNCYVFSPVCSPPSSAFDPNQGVKKKRVVLNRN